MPDCPASGQTSPGMKKVNEIGTGPVWDYADAVRHFWSGTTDQIDGCWNADAGVSFLDTDAQLRSPSDMLLELLVPFGKVKKAN